VTPTVQTVDQRKAEGTTLPEETDAPTRN
jgi:hypothetical protein